MKIVTLMENTKGAAECQIEHGLSVYVETDTHKVLVDTGMSGAFADNAKVLGVNLAQVDTVVLSHGHYDHAGGILRFLQANKTADIWMQESAKEAYYHKSSTEERYIGIDLDILKSEQVRLISGDVVLDDTLSLFTGVTERYLWPIGNQVLKVKYEGGFFQDEFQHEQYLVIQEQGKTVLISGCAHNGIINILRKFQQRYGQAPDIVISGFHMMNKKGYTESDFAIIDEIAEELKTYKKTVFYTGHCTGDIPFERLQAWMGEQVRYLHCGDGIEC